MGNYYYNQIYRKARILFIINQCPSCLVWKKFIDRLNCDVRIDKRILIINASNFADYGIIDHPMIKIFENKIKNAEGYADFPVLFFEGMKITKANSKEQVRAFINTCLLDDFIIPKENPYLFNKKCRFAKGVFGKKSLICEDAYKEE